MQKNKEKTKQTRNLLETRKQFLDTAFFEILSRGFQGVSIDEIVSKTSFTKGAFYHLFPTKLDLGYALVDEVISPMIIDRWIRPLKSYQNPLDGIRAQIDLLIGQESLKVLKLGCPLNNLTQEMSTVDPGFQKRLEKALKLWIRELERELTRAQTIGYLRRDVDVAHASHFLVMCHEGFYAMLKTVNHKSSFKALRSSLEIYLQSISVTQFS